MKPYAGFSCRFQCLDNALKTRYERITLVNVLPKPVNISSLGYIHDAVVRFIYGGLLEERLPGS